MATSGNINEQGANGHTALHTAAIQNKASLVKSLLKKNANPNIADDAGWHPLHHASNSCYFRVCDVLLTYKKYYKVEINAPTSDSNSTPLALLVKKETFDVASQLKTVQLFCSAGANLHTVDGDSQTLLHHACNTGTIEMVEFLLQNHLSPDVENKEGNTPLHLAVAKGRLNVATALIKAQCCPYSKNHNNESPIDIAKKHNFSALVKLLTDYSALLAKPAEFRLIANSDCPYPRRYHFASTFYQGNIVVIGGCNNKDIKHARQFFSSLLFYNLQENSWKEFPGDDAHAVAGHAVSLLGKVAYVTGGVSRFGRKRKEIWGVDLSNFQWTSHSNVPSHISTNYHKSVTVSRICVSFLSVPDHSSPLFGDVYDFDTTSNKWEPHPPSAVYPPYREKYSLTRVLNSLYLFGGENNGQWYNDLWMYDIKTNSWSLLPSVGAPTPRVFHTAAFHHDRMVVFGGIDKAGNELHDMYYYQPSSAKWAKFELNLPDPSFYQIGQSFLVDPKSNALYLFGGNPAPGVLEYVELAKPEPTEDETSLTLHVPDGLLSHSAPVPKVPSVLFSPREAVNLISSSTVPALGHVRGRSMEKLDELIHHSPVSEQKASQQTPSSQLKDLDEFADELTQEALHLVNLLQTLMLNPPAKKSKDSFDQLLRLCNEVEHKCSSYKPSASGPDPFAQLDLPPKRNKPLPSDFDSWDKDAKARYHVLNEILQTETEYVRDLGMVVGVLIRPLQTEYKDLVSQYDFNSMFKGIEPIFNLSRTLLAKLSKEEEKPSIQQDIGGVFLELQSELRLYIPYSANQIRANETLARLLKDSPEFATFTETARARPEAKHLSIDSLIIKPFQRVCRYPLLLKELRKVTPPTWSTYENISKAMAAIDVIVTAANEATRQTDHLVELIALQNRFVHTDADIMQMAKWNFIREGQLKYIKKRRLRLKPCQVLLFKQVLLLAEPRKGKLEKIAAFKMEQLVIHDIPDDTKPQFSVGTTDSEKLVIVASSFQEKKEWIDAIQEAGTAS